MTTSNNMHTVGPWELRVNGVFLRVVNGVHKSTVADGIVSEANARLIAAAPDYAAEVGFLLARLSDLDWSVDMDDFAREWEGHVSPSVERLAALHARATGEAA